jgi:hypothetical protein
MYKDEKKKKSQQKEAQKNKTLTNPGKATKTCKLNHANEIT